MHIVVGDVYCGIIGITDHERQYWPELYKLFQYEIPNAERQYAVQLKLLCLDLIGKQIYTLLQLKEECKTVIKSNRWHEELWKWYIEPVMRQAYGDGGGNAPVEIRNRLSALMTAKGKDTTTNLLDVLNGYSFYTGLLPKLLDFCEKRAITIAYADRRHMSLGALPYKGRHTIKMRPYQDAAILHAINTSVGTFNWYRGIFQIPTGGGKTEIAIALSMMYKGTTLFLVNRKELLHQTHERFSKAYGKQLVGLIGDGQLVYGGGEKVIIASAQTLWSYSKNIVMSPVLNKLIENVGQLIIDEAHGLAAGSFDTINTMVDLCSMFTMAHARWALTATPLMRDDLSNALLKGVTGDVVYQISTKELIKLGYLTQPKITFTKINHLSSYEDPITKAEMKRPKGSQWASLYDFLIKSPRRNKEIARVLATIPTPAIVLVKRLDHINYINHYLSAPLPFLKGTSSTEEREAAKKKLRSGEYKILCATTIFDEGVDIPEIRAIIMAGGGKSDIKTMQRMGRGLRLAAGKQEVLIYDFIDSCDDCPGWVPMKHSKDRMSVFKKEGFDICLL